jgi:organic hydroperoxide reductase OsmC/OhrA
MAIALPGVDRATAQAIVDAAHQTCPYSRAVQGNIPVELTLA